MDYLEKLCFIWSIVFVVLFVVNCAMPHKSPAEKTTLQLARLANSLFVLATVVYVWWLR